MDYDLSSTQRLIQEAAQSFVARECPLTLVREVVDGAVPPDAGIWQSIADQGWIGLHLPERFGGLDLSAVELAVVAEQLGRGCVPGPFLSTNWAATLLAAGSNEELARSFVPRLADGGLTAAVAILGDGLRWDKPHSGLEVSFDSERHRLDGRKVMVMDAGGADTIVCIAAAAGGDPYLIVVPSDAEGLEIRPTPGMDASRPLFEVVFDGVSVSPEQVACQGAAVLPLIRGANQTVAVLAAAELLGAAQWMLDTTVEYAKTRKQFDKVIGSFQAVQHQCADMLLLTESARSAVYYAAWALSEGDPAADAAVSIAKAYCSDAGRQVGNHAVQCHGGIGFTWEHDLHFFYKRVKAAEYLLGDATFHREELAKLLLDSNRLACTPRASLNLGFQHKYG